MAGCVAAGGSRSQTSDYKSNPSKESPQMLIVSGGGQVRYVDLEGGFYGIVSASGKYEPINLPDQFKVNKKDIWFKAKIRTDMASVHMWGKIIEIIEIK